MDSKKTRLILEIADVIEEHNLPHSGVKINCLISKNKIQGCALAYKGEQVTKTLHFPITIDDIGHVYTMYLTYIHKLLNEERTDVKDISNSRPIELGKTKENQ